MVVFNAHFPTQNLLVVALLLRFGWWRGKLVLSFHGSDVKAIDPGNASWRFIASQTDGITACSKSSPMRYARLIFSAASRSRLSSMGLM
ncbi:MAG: hypothetical protein MZV65_22530 [Chromatiales bacterium]|nr:hypothetical protein [Chromatiales bacterium]